MSFSYQKLNVVQVMDPITEVTRKRDYAVLRSGSTVSFNQYPSNNVSSGTIDYTITPPSKTMIDREFYHVVPIRFTINGNITTTNAGYVPPTSLINHGLDALRAYTMSSMTNTLKCGINNTSVTIDMGDTIHALLRFDTGQELKTGKYSMTPSYVDQSLNYSDLYGSNLSPLGTYSDGSEDLNVRRGGFPFTVINNGISNAPVIPSLVGTPASAIIDTVVCEPLWLSPFQFGLESGPGFYNVNSLTMTFNMYNQAGMRGWSHDSITPVSSSGGNSVFSNITSITVQFNQFQNPPFSYGVTIPTMLTKTITPNLLQSGLSDNKLEITYPYFVVYKQVKQIGTLPYAVGQLPGGGTSYSTDSITLTAVPNRVIIYGRPANSALLASPNLTDSYLQISGISITTDNLQGALSQASQNQLYLISKKNGLRGSWEQFSGYSVYNATLPPNAASTKYSAGGLPLCLAFGTDLPLRETLAPGCSANFQFQANVTLQNLNSTQISAGPPAVYAWDNVLQELMCLFIYEGTFTIPQLGFALSQTSVLSVDDVINSQTSPFVNYDIIKSAQGGNFFSNLKNFGQKIDDFLKESRIISNFSRLIPIVGEPISKTLKNIGIGPNGGCDENTNEVNERTGGRKINRTELKRRMK